MGTPDDRHGASIQFYKMGDIIPGIHLDGMDIFAVRETTKFATEYCPKNGPLVYEISTYRSRSLYVRPRNKLQDL